MAALTEELKNESSSNALSNDERTAHRRLGNGLAWVGGASWLKRLLLILAIAILAKKLPPRDFGELAIAALMSNVLIAFNDFGFGDAVVYEPDQPERAASVALTVCLVSGVVLAGLLTVSAPSLANFFHARQATGLIRIYALVVVFRALAEAPEALMTRSFSFARRFFPDGLAPSFGSIVTIVAALRGVGIWSLPLGDLVGAATETILAFALAGHVIVPRWDSALFRKMWRFGRGETASGLLDFGLGNVDYAIVGRVLGPVALGYYSFAFRLAIYPMVTVTLVLAGVVFPTVARIHHDRVAVRRFFAAQLRLGVLLTFAMGFGLIVIAPNIVVLGSKWQPAVRVAELLGAYVCLRTAAHLVTPVIKGLGKPGLVALLKLLWLVLLTVGLFITAPHGIVPVAVTQIVVSGVMILWHVIAGRAVFGLDPRAFALDIARAAATGVVGVLVIAVLRSGGGFFTRWHSFVTLLSTGTVFLAAYVIATLVVNRGVLADIRLLRGREPS